MIDFTTTCWTAVRDAAGGDHGERERFARRYEPVVRAYLGARWRDRLSKQDADDACQEVFLECFKEGGALQKATPDRPGGFRAFLHGVTRNVAARVEERHGRRREVALSSGVDPSNPSREADLARVFDRAWAGAIVEEAAAVQRTRAGRAGERAMRRVEILRLRFDEAIPIRDIARRLGESAETVHQEYALARKEFHRALREVVAWHLPGAAGELDRECQSLLELLEG